MGAFVIDEPAESPVQVQSRMDRAVPLDSLPSCHAVTPASRPRSLSFYIRGRAVVPSVHQATNISPLVERRLW